MTNKDNANLRFGAGPALEDMSGLMIVLVGLLFPCSSAPVSSSLVVLVRTPVSVDSGQTTTLPCWLNPAQNAEGLEVRWYHGDRFNAPIALYQGNKFSSEDESYVGRVAFGRKDAASGGLATGDVSLELVNVTFQDTGDYNCYVSSDRGYDSASVSLHVTKTGAAPLLSAEWNDDALKVSCESGGWYPQPTLRWSDGKGDVTPEGLEYSMDSSGHLSVHSWILVSHSSEVSCSVGLSGEEAKVARVHLGEKQGAGSSAAGWVAFALLLTAVLASLGVLYFQKKGPFSRKRDTSESAEENQKLLPQDHSAALEAAYKYYENVTLETGNPYLKSKNGMVRDGSTPPDGQLVTCLTSIRGTSGFSSGQHYWEVSLKRDGVVDVKQSWWVGVTSVTGELHKCDVPPTAPNGFWFLSSSPDREQNLQLNAEPNVSLYVAKKPQRLGVFLDYDRGELSFYNVEDKRLIASLTASFTGDVFPLFNPGKGDKAPMEVLQRAVRDQESNMNSIQSKEA